MREEVLINVNQFETRVAVLQNSVVQEVHLQRAGGYSMTGNIYKGRVARILPGMQAAFVDIGLSRPGFLHAKDVHASLKICADDLTGAKPAVRDLGGAPTTEDITQLLYEGQALLVQVIKDPILGKGARLSTELALASRYLVLMPFSHNLGVSQRIEDECERERLRTVVDVVRKQGAMTNAGWIVRTAAEGASEADLAMDLQFLKRMWDLIENSQRYADPPSLIYEELPLHIRVVRDLVGPQVEAVRIDSAETFARVEAFTKQFLPEFLPRLEHYQDALSLFDRHGVEEEIAKALDARVPLRSGGYLIIEQTESMTTIDVNTGGFVGSRNLEETVFRTNLEAAATIPRQLRLRNLGGIIVIDFIDMEDAEHQRQVLRALEKACEQDPARVRISGISSLGLVEMSRKRTRESLRQQLCAPCPACQGRGTLKTAESMCNEIFRAILRDAKRRGNSTEAGDYLVRASQNVVDRLLDEAAANVESLAFEIGRSIRFQVEPSYTNEQFDIVLMQDLKR